MTLVSRSNAVKKFCNAQCARKKQVVSQTMPRPGACGHSRWLLTEVVQQFLVGPRARPVERSRFVLVADGSVRHHGASPWHLANLISSVLVAANMKHHRASLWYRLMISSRNSCFTFAWFLRASRYVLTSTQKQCYIFCIFKVSNPHPQILVLPEF